VIVYERCKKEEEKKTKIYNEKEKNQREKLK
jgi:hypothetical protein